MQIFNNREISIAIWGAIVLGFFLTKPDTRTSAKELIKSFFHWKIIMVYLLAVAYTGIGILLFQRLGIWTVSQLKDTVIWSIFTVFGILLSLNKVRENESYFKDAVKENFKRALILEFIMGLYTFSLGIELIVVPLATSLAITKAFAENDKQFASVKKPIDNILVLFGLIAIGHTIYEITIHIRELASYDTLRDFVLSPLLALWILPFVYLMSLYMTYEAYYVTLSFKFEDKALLKFAKRQALLKFNIDTKSFDRWKSRLFIGSVNSKKDILDSIAEIRRLQAIEKNPPPVDPALGWSPYQAKDFLAGKGIRTGFYDEKYDNNWSAISKYIQLEKEYPFNTVSYDVRGNSGIVKELNLVLNVNRHETEKAAIQTFIEYADALYMAATNENMPGEIKTAFAKGKALKIEKGTIEISASKDIWSKEDGRYTLYFSIIHQ